MKLLNTVKSTMRKVKETKEVLRILKETQEQKAEIMKLYESQVESCQGNDREEVVMDAERFKARALESVENVIALCKENIVRIWALEVFAN